MIIVTRLPNETHQTLLVPITRELVKDSRFTTLENHKNEINLAKLERNRCSIYTQSFSYSLVSS